MSKETEAKIIEAIENAEEFLEPLDVLPDEFGELTGEPLLPKGQPTQTSFLVQLAREFELFHTPDGTAYADIHVDGHRETYRIDSRFERILKYRFYKLTSEPAAPEAVRKARELLEVQAQCDGPTRQVYVRVAALDELLYIDLGGKDWRVIEISRNGWRVIQNPPVRFCRSSSMQALPTPEKGGSIEILRKYLNVSKDDFVLIVAWLLAALRHPGPYPVLVLSGEHGSAKSTAANILRALVDPNTSPLRAIPKEERDLFVSAKHEHVLAFDNLSSLSASMSDSLCRLATGGGYGARRLYTDDDETLFQAQRPVILNGIEQVATREDLADRAITVTLEPIPGDRRMPEGEFQNNFEKDRAVILGALIEMMANGLRCLPSVKPVELPRMADSAKWAIACERNEWPSGTFEAAYKRNRQEAVDSVLDADPVAVAVLEMAQTMRTMRTQTSPSYEIPIEWRGTASELLGRLNNIAAEKTLKDRNWPKTPNALSNRLTRATPFLRERGLGLTKTREGHSNTRMIYIWFVGDKAASSIASAASSASPARKFDNRHYDDHDDDLSFEEGDSIEPEEFTAMPSASRVSIEGTNSTPKDLNGSKKIIVKRPNKTVRRLDGLQS